MDQEQILIQLESLAEEASRAGYVDLSERIYDFAEETDEWLNGEDD